MNFLFKTKQRSPHDLVRSMRDAMMRLGVVETGPDTLVLRDAPSSEVRRKQGEELHAGIQQAKHLLYGEGGQEPVPEQVAQLAQDVYQMHLIQYLLVYLPRLEFEARKDVVQIFAALLQRKIGTRLPTVEYIAANPVIVILTLRGYADADIALNTGMMLHELLQHEALAKILLYSDDFYRFPEYIDTTSFGISCDAFANFRETLVRHRAVTAEYLEQHYERVCQMLTQFFAMYNQLLDSSNYVTKRQSLKLLGGLLVDRANYNTMLRYVADENNLKRIMNLFRDRSRNIQLETFHVFKVFVANPKKTPAVEAILQRNRSRLLAFLSDFQRDRTDESFIDERQYVMQIIAALPASSKGA
ncbi:Hym1p [Malassezia brasiliensis]|uniref:Hym1p n=1 Tax=Malassezia brasiliensis TaxID=1821822 RepID=A0AAF0IR12_9BASI|nr:Hym1p [Malassezia brasiliensis]